MSDAEEFLNEMKAEHPEAFQEERSAACYEKDLAALQRDNARLREALEPFAAFAKDRKPADVDHKYRQMVVRWKHVTAARLALEPRDDT